MERFETNEHVICCLSLLENLMSLIPNTVVELVPQYVERSHHCHVKKEEAHKTSRAEVAEKRIHPNPN